MQSRIKSDVVVLFHGWNLMTPLHYQITLVYSISHPPLSCTFKITEIGDSGEKLFEKNENPVKFDKHCLFPFVLDDRFRDLGFRAGLGLGSVLWVLRDHDAGIRCTNAIWPHLHPQPEYLTIQTCITMIRAVSRISNVASAGQILAQFHFAIEYIAWDCHCNNSIYLIRIIHQFCHHLSPVNIYVVDFVSDIFFNWVYLEVFVEMSY